MHYLEDWGKDTDAIPGQPEPEYSLPMTPGLHIGIGDVDGVSVLRLHNVVIDLTGAIRG